LYGNAATRGVAVQLIADDFNTEPDGFNTNLIMLEYLSRKGVQVKIFKSDRYKSTHAKDLIVDDRYQITGSGNLTQGALLNNRESAILIESADLNKLLSQRYEGYWNLATPYTPLVTGNAQ
jgi:phosphatidylserine/phosphatidylglycerophosphate/cardiolipin synthase-like enzyme